MKSQEKNKVIRKNKTQVTIAETPAAITMQDRYRGCLLGLAAGDALGASNEFKRPGTFRPVQDLVGGGPFGLKAGQWTDDTSCALCLAETLAEYKCLQADDAMRRLLAWLRHGYLSSNGKCFDVGGTTRGALVSFERTGDPWQGKNAMHGNTNGSIMRLAPVPMQYAENPQKAVILSGVSAMLTHGGRQAVDAARYLGCLISGLLRGESRDSILPDGACYSPVGGSFWSGEEMELDDAVRQVAEGGYRRGKPYAGFDALSCLNAALWAFESGSTFVETVQLAANLGNDSDTVAAVAGQLAGAYYGVDGIPASWLKKLAMRERITELADRIFTQRDAA